MTVDSTGAISTQGAQSNGIFAQSVGGGGGNGGFAISAAGANYGAVSLGFGGGASNGGLGAAGTVTSTGAVTTAGDFSNHEYAITRNAHPVATISKQWFTLPDTYGVDIGPGEDDILLLVPLNAT